MANAGTEGKVDYVITTIQQSIDKIVAACEIGVPVDDAVCALVRKSLATPAADLHQPDLFDETKGAQA